MFPVSAGLWGCALGPGMGFQRRGAAGDAHRPWARRFLHVGLCCRQIKETSSSQAAVPVQWPQGTVSTAAWSYQSHQVRRLSCYGKGCVCLGVCGFVGPCAWWLFQRIVFQSILLTFFSGGCGASIEVSFCARVPSAKAGENSPLNFKHLTSPLVIWCVTAGASGLWVVAVVVCFRL